MGQIKAVKMSTMVELIRLLTRHVQASQISTHLYQILKDSDYSSTEIEEVIAIMTKLAKHDKVGQF